MKGRRSLRDIFNVKAAKRVALVLSMTAAFSGCAALPGKAEAIPQKAAPTVPCPGAAAAKPKIPHNEELMRENDDQPPSQALLQMNDEQRFQYYMAKFCFTLDDAANDKNPRDRGVILALDSLRGVSIMGKPLIDLAAQNHLKFCALHHMPAGTGAQYWSGYKFVAAGPNSRPQGEVLDIAHEITHAAQDRHGLLSYGYAWDIQSRVRRNLTVEAAPIAMEFSVAYEKKLEGDPSYWEFLKTRGGPSAYMDPKNRDTFEKTYQQNLAAGKTSDESLHAAAHALFLRVFESDDWRRFYLTSELNSYVEDVASGKFHQFTAVTHNAFGQDKIDKAGQIGDLPSYTKGAQIPSYDYFFKADVKMKWAYEAVDAARYRQSLGDKDPTVIAMLAQAKADKNPYISIDMEELDRRLQSGTFKSQFKTTWQVMDEMIKDAANPAYKPAAKPAPHNCVVPAAPVLTQPKIFRHPPGA